MTDSAGVKNIGDVITSSQRELEVLDSIAAQWCAALDVAADALHVADACRRSLGFGEHELCELTWRLTHERDVTARLLDSVARDEHISLERRPG